MTAAELTSRLEKLGSEANLEGMARYGIRPEKALGVPMPVVRALAREHGRDHDMALELWESGVHEIRLLAAFIADPKLVDTDMMEQWVLSFDSWALCDTTCGSLFRKSNQAWDKALEWCGRGELYVKRAGFAMIAWLAVHDKKVPDSKFTVPLKMIRKEAGDERPLVRKAVNWALRQIGKRNLKLNTRAIALAVELSGSENSSERWVANDALRELTSSKIQVRLTPTGRAE